MLVKKFRSETFEEALKEVKRDMGARAVILSRKTVKEPGKGVLGIFGKQLVELTAAIDRRERGSTSNESGKERNTLSGVPGPRDSEKKASESGKGGDQDLFTISKEARKLVGKGSAQKRVFSKKYVEIDNNDSLEELMNEAGGSSVLEMRGQKESPDRPGLAVSTTSSRMNGRNGLSGLLKEDLAGYSTDAIMEALSEPSIARTPKALKKLCLNLTLSGVDSKYINELARGITENLNPLIIKRENYLEGYAAKFLMDRMKFSGGIHLVNHGPRVAVLIGPAGAGKTTTIAKFAALFKGQKKNVGLITMDVHRIGAIEQLKVYANILKVPLKAAGSASDFSGALGEMREMDVILVDTTGRGKKDGEAIGEMKRMLNFNLPFEKHLCLSSCMRDNDALEAVRRFSVVGVDRLLFTKIDETSVHGGIYNIMRKSEKPISYFTSGQRVPEDMEVAGKERLVDLILKLSSN